MRTIEGDFDNMNVFIGKPKVEHSNCL